MELLEQKRKRHEEGVQAIQETARKLTIVGRLMGENLPGSLAVSSDRHSLEYWLEDGEHDYLTATELEGLRELVSGTHFLKFEIKCMEEGMPPIVDR